MGEVSWRRAWLDYEGRFKLDCELEVRPSRQRVRPARGRVRSTPFRRVRTCAHEMSVAQGTRRGHDPRPRRPDPRCRLDPLRRREQVPAHGRAAVVRVHQAATTHKAQPGRGPGQEREADPALTGCTVWDGAIVLARLVPPAAPASASSRRRTAVVRGRRRARGAIARPADAARRAT